MEQLSVEQVIEFAQSVEKESYTFYTEAKARLREPSLVSLCGELAEAEIDHLNRLKHLLDMPSVTEEQLRKQVSFDTAEYQRVVASGHIEPDTTARAILEQALARERATANSYTMLVSITDLSADVIDLFSYLSKQEQGHVTKIRNKIEGLKD